MWALLGDCKAVQCVCRLLSSIMFLFITLFGCLVVWYFLTWKHPKNFPPGPRLHLPMLGNSLPMLINGDVYQSMRQLSDIYGDYCGFWLGKYRAVTIKDFDGMHTLLSQTSTTGRQKIAAKSFRRGYSFDSTPGLLLSQSQSWTELRRTSLHFLRDLGMGKSGFDDLINQEVDNFVQFIDENYVNQPVDIDPFFNRATVAIIWRIISNESLMIGCPRLEKMYNAAKMIAVEFGDSFIQSTIDNESVFYWVQKLGFSKMKTYFDDMFEEFETLIHNLKSSQIDDDENPATITEQYVKKMKEITDENHVLFGSRGHLNLLNVLSDLIIAGSDTSANALQWSMLYLMLHPEHQWRIVEEADLDEKPFTEAFLWEVHRKGKVVPTSVFHVTNEDTEVKDYFLPKGTIIIPLIGEIMRNPEYFPNPEVFDPERYLTYDNDKLHCHPHPKLIPFGIGRRRCLGEPIANVSLKTFVSKLLQKYELVPASKLQDLPREGYIKGPMPFKMIFKPRK